MIRSSLAAALATTLAAATAPSATAQEAGEQRLGAVHFETSCNETAQRRFDRGMRYQHSFWYRASKEIFEDVLKADPDCAIDVVANVPREGRPRLVLKFSYGFGGHNACLVLEPV